MSAELEYGEVSAVDYKHCRIRVRLDDRDGVQSYWLNVPQQHTQGTKSRPLMPELGEQVAVLLDADGVGGVYLGGVYSTAEPPPVVDQDTDYVRFSDGTVVTYDRAAHAMLVDCVGSIEAEAATTVTVKAGAQVLVQSPRVTLDTSETILTGDLKVAGLVEITGAVALGAGLQAEGDIKTKGKVLDEGGNSNHHSH